MIYMIYAISYKMYDIWYGVVWNDMMIYDMI